MTSKTIKTTLFASLILGLSATVLIPNAQADLGQHTCLDSDGGSHCYAIAILEWVQWPWGSGEREEYGVKGNLEVKTVTTASGTDHFSIHSLWIRDAIDGSWVEVGWMRGGDTSVCGTDAATTPRYYWVSYDGSPGVPDSGCKTNVATSGTPYFELSDTNKDGDWIIKAATYTLQSARTNDFGKGHVHAGGESTHYQNTMDSKATNLQYYDTQWRNWVDNILTETHTYYDIDECTATSFEFGSDNPVC